MSRLGLPALAVWCPSGPPVRRGRPFGFESPCANSGALVHDAVASTRIEGCAGMSVPDPSMKRPRQREVHQEVHTV